MLGTGGNKWLSFSGRGIAEIDESRANNHDNDSSLRELVFMSRTDHSRSEIDQSNHSNRSFNSHQSFHSHQSQHGLDQFAGVLGDDSGESPVRREVSLVTVEKMLAETIFDEKSPRAGLGSNGNLPSADLNEIVPAILEKIEAIDWAEIKSIDVQDPGVVARLKAINLYLVKNIRDKVGLYDRRENLNYLSGFIASISFANVLNSKSLIKTNAMITSSILVYRLLDLYVQTVAVKQDHFQRQYDRINALLNESFENELIVNMKDGGISCGYEMIGAIEALVVAFYKLEQETNQPITHFSKNKVTDCCINMMRALLTFINEEASKDKKRMQSLSGQEKLSESFANLLISQRESFKYYMCLPSLHHLGAAEPVTIPSMQDFSRIIRNHYIGQNTYHNSGRDLLEEALNPETFVQQNRDIEMDHDFFVPEAINEFFALLSHNIQDEQKIRRDFILINSLLFLSSIFYGLSFNLSSLSLGRYVTFVSAAAAFIVAQKVDSIQAEIYMKHSVFKEAKQYMERGVKDGFVRSAQAHHKTDWINHCNNGEAKVSRKLHQVNYMVAETWSCLKAAEYDPKSFNHQDMASASMHMYISMCSAYEKTAPHFEATPKQITNIAAACAELIKDNIRDKHWYDVARLCSPLTGVMLGQVPKVDDFYKVVDNVIHVSETLHKYEDNQRGQHLPRPANHNNVDSSMEEPPRTRSRWQEAVKRVMAQQRSSSKSLNSSAEVDEVNVGFVEQVMVRAEVVGQARL